MKIKLTFFLMLYCCLRSSGQMSEFAPIGAKWWYGYNEISATGYVIIESTGDTIIAGNSCRVLTKTKHFIDLAWPDPEEHVFSMGEDYIFQDDSIIYYYSDGSFWTLYDFTASVGDTWQVYYNDPDVIYYSECDSTGTLEVVTSTDTLIAGTTFKKLTTQSLPGSLWSFDNSEILEKTGSLFYLFPSVTNCISVTDLAYPAPLRCYEDNTIGLIKFSEEECDYIYLGISETSKSAFSIWPNPTEETVHLKGDLEADMQITLTDITGKEIPVYLIRSADNILSADISFLPAGIYLITVLEDHNPIGTQKLIKL